MLSSSQRNVLLLPAIVVAVFFFLTAGCASTEEGSDPTTTAVQAPDKAQAIGAGISINVPGDSEITPISDEVTSWPREPASCTHRQGSIKIGANYVSADLVGSKCVGNETLNGNRGAFLKPDQPPQPENVESFELAIGTLTYFEHLYTECTNSCESWTVSYALVELANPQDADHPTLLLNTDKDSGIDLKEYAQTLS